MSDLVSIYDLDKHSLIRKYRDLEKKSADTKAKAKNLFMVLEHAIELGYLGEGSTAAMARAALADFEEEGGLE